MSRKSAIVRKLKDRFEDLGFVPFENWEGKVENRQPQVVKEEVKGLVKNTQVTANVKGKMLFMPLRIALTGEMHGPDFSSLVYLLGKEEIINRLNKVIK